MRVAVLLLLSFTLSDGLNNVSLSNDQLEMFSDIFFNLPHPCQRSRNNNAYNQFKRRHILSRQFNTRQTSAWADYLTGTHLCGRTTLQSFLHKNDNESIIRICNGRGVRDTGNRCISRRTFTVYIVESFMRNGRCEVNRLHNAEYYVVVSCEVIANQCLPVHYVRQSNGRPSRSGQICRPQSEVSKAPSRTL